MVEARNVGARAHNEWVSGKDLGARQVGWNEDDRSATILHVDMDAFFVSVELLERPELRGEPVIVGGTGGRGVVSSASYEARAFGVRSAMPMSEARRWCPQAVVLPGQMSKYREQSRRVMALFHEFTPLVEPLSIDEAFLDVSGAMRLFGPPASIARQVRERVLAETGLSCSVGGGASKFVAKLASGKCKPSGTLIISEQETIPFLHTLPVTALWGVGQATAEKLRGRGISTVRELANTSKETLVRALGRAQGERLHDLAWGRDPRRVETQRQEKSVSHEQTFTPDLTGVEELERELRAQSDAVARRLRAAGLEARGVTLKLRWPDFTTITRSRTLSEATDTGHRLFREVRELLREANPQGRAIRLIGVRADHLHEAGSGAVELPLWDETQDDEWREAERTVDRALAKFGTNVIRPASLLGRGERRDGTTGLSDRPPSHP